MRIVSLVPSLTETVVAYGRLDQLVGRTRYCTEPQGIIDSVETVGGTKNPDLERIIALRPDLVIVNREENRLEDAVELERAGLPIHVTHPRSVAEAISMLEGLGEAVDAAEAGGELVARCRQAVEDVGGLLKGFTTVRTFCPIWRKPWMAFRERTYIGNVLFETGFENVFGNRDGDDFFEVSIDEIVAAEPEVLLLPDEPYVFTPDHGRELASDGVSGVPVLVDGKLLAWYGPRLPGALVTLANISKNAAAYSPDK